MNTRGESHTQLPGIMLRGVERKVVVSGLALFEIVSNISTLIIGRLGSVSLV